MNLADPVIAVVNTIQRLRAPRTDSAANRSERRCVGRCAAAELLISHVVCVGYAVSNFDINITQTGKLFSASPAEHIYHYDNKHKVVLL